MTKRMPKALYERELAALQAKLVEMQAWVQHSGARVVVIFEGRDAAGKGSTIKRVSEYLNPRVTRIVALPTPSARDKTRWYFQRYVPHLPAAGEIVLMDRSWYNRAGVERVMGYCTNEEYHRFLHQAPIFERMLVEDGIILLKYWFSVSDVVQEERSGRASGTRCGGGSSARTTCSRSPSGRTTRARRTRCRAHRHRRGALVRGPERRQAALAHQHDRPPAVEGPMAARRARADRHPSASGVDRDERPPRDWTNTVPDYAQELIDGTASVD